MALNCNLLFSYASKREYVGVLNFRNVTSLQVQSIFDASVSSGSNPVLTAPLLTGTYTGIVVNGVDFGTGRIVSFSNPVSTELTEDGRHFWKQIVNVEVYSSGEMNNLGLANSMSGLHHIYNDHLADFSESFNFDLTPNGDYQYAHDVNVKCYDECTGLTRSGYLLAQAIASGVMSARPSFGHIDALHSGYFTSIGRRTYSESVDILNGSVSATERFSIQNRDFVKHTFAFDNGFVNVTETATIRHSGISTASEVFSSNPNDITTRFNNAYGGAWARCQSLWNTYSSVMGSDTYTTALNTSPAQLTKSFDEKNQEFTYTVTFSNNPQMTTLGYAIDRQQSFVQTPLGVQEITEDATLTAYGTKDTSLKSFLTSAVNSEMAGIYTRLSAMWGSMGTTQLVADNKSVSSHGKQASYSATYSNDPSFINNGVYLTRNISLQDNGPVRMHQAYLILGKSRPLVHNPGQTQFGSVTCTINVTWPRPEGFTASDPEKPMSTLNQMFVDAVNSLLNYIAYKTPLDVFVTKVEYTYGSNLAAELTTEAQYVYARNENI